MRAGDNAVHAVCAGETSWLFTRPGNRQVGGDDGGGGEGVEGRRASIQESRCSTLFRYPSRGRWDYMVEDVSAGWVFGTRTGSRAEDG